MKVSKVSLLLILLFTITLVPLVNAQFHAGGQGLMYTHSARTLEKGGLNAFFHSYEQNLSSEISDSIKNISKLTFYMKKQINF